MKQTAVEWLVSVILDESFQEFYAEEIAQAKEMEKEQTCGFAIDFIDDRCYAAFDGRVKYDDTPESYYDEIFNSDEE